MSRIEQHNRKEFDWILTLHEHQGFMLHNKDEALSQLYRLCDTDAQRDLIKDLIIRFNCFDEEVYNLALTNIARYIISLNYPISKTAIVAFAHNHEADSSQSMLQKLKVSLGVEGVSSPKTINRFDKIERIYNKEGVRHFIVIDEFIGSGETLLSRYKEFENKRLPNATIDFCIMAGMSDAIRLAAQNGIKLRVEYSMSKGISQYYKGKELTLYTGEMMKLEDKLAAEINSTRLTDYNFGYGRSEALFNTLYGNIPNNVFPLFWWKIGSDQKKKVTLFTRVQDGY